MKSKILATGSAFPSRLLRNTDLSNRVRNYDPERSGKSLDAWIWEHYGIRERRWADQEKGSDLATEAAKIALRRAGLSPNDLDFLILHTATGDYRQPTTATQVQGKLGMRPGSFALEINMPCAGSIYALSVADGFLKTGAYQFGLVIGVELMSSLIDPEDFVMAGLFGDGAGACVLGRSEEGGISRFVLGSRAETGPEAEYALGVLGGGSVHPPMQAEPEFHRLQMNSRKVKPLILSTVRDSIRQVLEADKLGPEAVSSLIPHQASRNFILEAAASAGIPTEKVLFSLEKFGNTASASILVTLDLYHETALKSGNYLIFAGVGGGLNWGALSYHCP